VLFRSHACDAQVPAEGLTLFQIVWRIVVVVAAGYLLGGIPFGVIVTRRMHGVEITSVGSGNTGATNVFRAVGWRAALIVALLDVAKGAAPALFAYLLAEPAWADAGRDLLIIAAGVAAMTGHMFSPYFRLRGGKGIATAAGAILVLMPKAFLLLLALFVAAILVIRIVSVASLLAAAVFPLAILWLYPERPVLFAFASVLVPLVAWSHRANIARLLRGEEPRITMGRTDAKRGKERS
jgi:glycerol-3-phosphate acyltransferase PlsY